MHASKVGKFLAMQRLLICAAIVDESER